MAENICKAPDSLEQNYVWWPQPGPQSALLFAKKIPEVLYGGAKFGGKSDGLLGDYLSDLNRYGKNWQGIIFRSSYPELEEILRRSLELFPKAGGEWKEGKRKWDFANGASLKLRFLESVKDFYRYNGHSYPWIGVDELGQWPSLEGYHMLKGCLRWAAYDIPVKRIRATANPGGPGHQAVMQYFELDKHPGGYHLIQDPRSGMIRTFIPSFAEDNQLGLLRDPGYLDRLEAVGDEALVEAWKRGRWDIIAGAYFKQQLFICEPFEIPKHWLRFRTLDWGSARPFSVGWHAVSEGKSFRILDRYKKEREVYLPPNCIIRYREWYGAKSPNVGLDLTVPEVSRGILDRSLGENIAYSVADPSIFIEDGGPSKAEVFYNHGVQFKPADNSRLAGWQQIKIRQRGLEGNPMLVIFSNCSDLIRTFPALQHDRHKPEDLDSRGEDHPADELRYGCMSRPWVEAEEKPPEPAFREPTTEELLKMTLNTTQRYKRI